MHESHKRKLAKAIAIICRYLNHFIAHDKTVSAFVQRKICHKNSDAIKKVTEMTIVGANKTIMMIPLCVCKQK